jgi:hypothetical protein
MDSSEKCNQVNNWYSLISINHSAWLLRARGITFKGKRLSDKIRTQSKFRVLTTILALTFTLFQVLQEYPSYDLWHSHLPESLSGIASTFLSEKKYFVTLSSVWRIVPRSELQDVQWGTEKTRVA